MGSTPVLKGQIAQDLTGLGYDMRIDLSIYKINW